MLVGAVRPIHTWTCAECGREGPRYQFDEKRCDGVALRVCGERVGGCDVEEVTDDDAAK